MEISKQLIYIIYEKCSLIDRCSHIKYIFSLKFYLLFFLFLWVQRIINTCEGGNRKKIIMWLRKIHENSSKILFGQIISPDARSGARQIFTRDMKCKFPTDSARQSFKKIAASYLLWKRNVSKRNYDWTLTSVTPEILNDAIYCYFLYHNFISDLSSLNMFYNDIKNNMRVLN